MPRNTTHDRPTASQTARNTPVPEYLPYSPLGGVNSTDNESALEPSQCNAATNLLFEAGAVRNRPGLVNLGVTGLPGTNPAYVSSIELAGNFYNVAIDASLLWVAQSNAFTNIPIPGGAPAFDLARYQSLATANGALLVPNAPSVGLIRWIPGASAATLIAPGAYYRYVTSLASRAVGGYDPTVTAPIGQRKVGWSVAGDETTWTGSTNGSGSTVLTDIPDEITGMAVLYNLWVIYRRFGIHIGTLTGQAFPPFSFSSWNQNGVGCFYPSSLATSDNVSFFIGSDDVYMFDTQQLTPIGYNIRNELFLMIGNQQFLPRGFTTRTYLNGGDAPRLRYNLVPMSGDGSPAAVHYIYDVRDRVWSRQHYSFVLSTAGGFNYVTNQTLYGTCIVDAGGTFRLWQGACDEQSSLTTKTFVLGQPERDYKVHRVLLVYRDKFSASVSVTIQLTSTLGGQVQVAASTKLLGGANDWQWKRQWYDITLPGNFFTATVTVPNGVQFQMSYLSLKYDAIGEFLQ
jgi:hypothetical protein